MKTLFITIAFAAFIIGILQACALKNPDSAPGKFTIIIQDPNHNAAMAAPGLLPQYYFDGTSFILSTPSSTADFNCFGVNVTGAGVLGNGKNFGNCTNGDNFNGRGKGATSDLAPRGTPITVDVTAGLNRVVDVYGIYPSLGACGGTGGTGANPSQGYFLGSQTVNVLQGTTVSVPISMNSNASFTCTDPLGFPVPLASGDFMPLGGSCTFSHATPPNTPTPTGSGGSAPSGGYLAELVNENGSMVVADCNGSGGTTQFIDFVFDTAGVPLNTYSGAKVIWKGRSGFNSGTCSGGTQSTPFSGGGGATLWIYNNSNTTWTQLGGTTAGGLGLEGLQGSVASPSSLPVTGSGGVSKVFVRMLGPAGSGGTSCIMINTDFIELRLQ